MSLAAAAVVVTFPGVTRVVLSLTAFIFVAVSELVILIA